MDADSFALHALVGDAKWDVSQGGLRHAPAAPCRSPAAPLHRPTMLRCTAHSSAHRPASVLCVQACLGTASATLSDLSHLLRSSSAPRKPFQQASRQQFGDVPSTAAAHSTTCAHSAAAPSRFQRIPEFVLYPNRQPEHAPQAPAALATCSRTARSRIAVELLSKGLLNFTSDCQQRPAMLSSLLQSRAKPLAGALFEGLERGVESGGRGQRMLYGRQMARSVRHRVEGAARRRPTACRRKVVLIRTCVVAPPSLPAEVGTARLLSTAAQQGEAAARRWLQGEGNGSRLCPLGTAHLGGTSPAARCCLRGLPTAHALLPLHLPPSLPPVPAAPEACAASSLPWCPSASWRPGLSGSTSGA